MATNKDIFQYKKKKLFIFDTYYLYHVFVPPIEVKVGQEKISMNSV